MTLVSKFQIDDREQQRRKRFLGIDDADVELLRSALPMLERNVDWIVAQFYAHLLSFTETKAFFVDEAALLRAKKAQREYLLDLFRGNYDSAYIERRLQIGVVHERIGLPAKWYLGGNAVFFELIVSLLVRKFRFRRKQLTRSILALNKLMCLDQSLVMDTYIGTMVDKIQGLSDRVLQTIEVLAPTAQQASDLATVAAETTEASMQVAEEGATAVEQALGAMNELEQTAKKSVEEVRRLSERIGQIGAVINLLDEFTADTNVLALNASVQAARAGQQSTGFSVIADQIRKLADESQESLAQVHSLVSEIKEATTATMTAFAASAEEVEKGTHLTLQIGDAFKALASSSRDAAASVQQITVNVKEQSTAIVRLKEMVDREKT